MSGTNTEKFENALQTARPADKQIPLTKGYNVVQSGFDLLTGLVEKFFTVPTNVPDILPAMCLQDATEGTGKDYKVKVRCRIHELHKHLPLPRHAKDFEIIDMYPEYVAEDPSKIGGVPKAGQILEVMHEDKSLLFHGYGTGKIISITAGMGSFVSGVEEPSEPFKACFEGYPDSGVVITPAKVQQQIDEAARKLAFAATTLVHGTDEAKTKAWNALPTETKEQLINTFKEKAREQLGISASGNPVSNSASLKNRTFNGQPCSKFFKIGEVIQGDRKVSAAGKVLLHKLEGAKNKPYRDSAKDRWWTVGIGSLIDKRRKDGQKRFKKYKEFVIANGGTAAQADAYQGSITDEQMNIMAENDIKKFEDVVNRQFKGVPLTQTQFEALVSFAYNAGSVKNPLRDAIKKNPNDPSLGRIWTNQTVTAGGKHLPGLVKRRRKEVDHYFGRTSSRYTPKKDKTKFKSGKTEEKKAKPKKKEPKPYDSSNPWAQVAEARTNYFARRSRQQ